MTKIITLTQGKEAIVDDDMFDYINQWKWYYDHDGYAERHESRPNRKTLHMHRVIMNTPPGMDTDHIDGNHLNNTRENLRICTRSQNMMNCKKHTDNESGYKGITQYGKFWKVQIRKNGKNIWVGDFKTKEEAARAYDIKAAEFFGEFSKTNF